MSDPAAAMIPEEGLFHGREGIVTASRYAMSVR
jgi:hypothetical protein